MWWPLFAAILIHFVVVQPSYAYSRFGPQSDEIRALYGNGGPLSMNGQLSRDSNVHYYGRFRSGQDDVLSRYFHRQV